jgi:competence protein ComEC
MSNPALLPAISLLTGILAGAFAPAANPRIAATVIVTAWLAAVLAHARKVDRAARVSIALAFAACGALLAAHSVQRALHSSLRDRLEEEHVLDDGSEGGSVVVVEGRVREDATQGPAGVRLSLDVSRVTIASRTHAVSGGVIVGVSGDAAALSAPEWTAGRTLRLPVLLRRPARYLDPGVADQDVSLARRGTCAVGTAKSAALIEVVARGHVWDEWAAAIRQWTRHAIAAHVGVWSAQSGALVTALLIGDRAGLDDAIELRLQEAGTYHVIAISGGNIAILAGAMAGVLALMRIRSRLAALITIAMLLAYAFIVGGSASVVRATSMAVVYLAARVGDHRSAPFNALGVAAALIASASPLTMFDAAFALTFGATLAILVGAGWIRPRLPSNRMLRAITSLFAASVCAEVALFPIGVFVFSRVTFAGLVLNFAAIPLMAVAQLAGVACLALGACSHGAGLAAGFVAHVAVRGLIASATLVDLAPWLTYRLPPPSFTWLAIYYSALTLTVAWQSARRRERRALHAVTAISAVWILIAPASLTRPRPAGHLTVTFFDVGQGDSALVRFPNGATLLVDTGGAAAAGGFDLGARVLAPALWTLGVRHLTYLALTHGDPDHIGGAAPIMRDFVPSEIWYGTPVPPHVPSNLLIDEANGMSIPWRTVLAGDAVDVGGVHVRVSHPGPPEWERQRVRNDDSIVMELTFGDVSILLTGDIGRDIERALASHLAPSRLRVVKVAHHGSATSSDAAFVLAAKPAVAVVSCGRGNRYGHPVLSVIERYQTSGAAVFRTDQDGAVTVTTGGHELLVSSYTGRTYEITR